MPCDRVLLEHALAKQKEKDNVWDSKVFKVAAGCIFDRLEVRKK